MLARRIGASGPERIFMIMYNSYGTASLTNGQAVMIDYATDANGVSVTKPAAGNKSWRQTRRVRLCRDCG